MNAATSIGVVAHYNLLERLEPAGPGDLYRARDTHHGRTVVVRLLPPGDDQHPVLERAESLTRLSHPNAVTVFSAGLHDGRVYVAFEHVNGTSLRAEMSGRQMNSRRAVELAIEMADAVAEAHAFGFIHSGLSPDAVGINAKGHAKIPAFHLGTTLGFSAPGNEQLIDYVSPEEGRGELPDERSDVYSVGAVLYEMLTGRRPMPRGAAAPSATNSRVPKEVDTVVLKAVAPNPERRFQSAAELAAALRSVLSTLELPDVPPDLRGTEGTTVGRILLTTLAILGALAVVVWWLTRS